ncbi:oxidoreductase, 2OG-Fe(II) oxygenase [Chryseobacterium sp. Tr-659]|uniref:2OG-Fe(II) oxygenase n=1 Tax=Chryseobacterium sp. Tr-659 TaxID=2608340 RepID=UPI00141E72E2|nr:2OG-Fe(II) oxygenase [Chryseobacterium sp. Tr-659]NIF05844.1 oxidoreductase, 2OG-Fe(II) oxygenase [Chryseobacterium sp. Tr-659]
MEKIELHPQIFLIKNFLAEEECDQYIKLSQEKDFEEAKITVFGQQQMSKGVRNNDRLMIFDETMAEDLFKKAAAFLPQEHNGYKLLNFNEMFRVYRYTSGQQFKMHRDGSYIRNEKEKSLYTFMIYLNDDFEGGETEFENLCTVSPEKGTALIFHHPLRHEGKTLISGLKYVLRTDVMFSRE